MSGHELPVIEPTMMTRLRLSTGADWMSSSSRLVSRKWPKWLVATLSSKPSAVNVGSLAVGRYTAALQTSTSSRLPLARKFCAPIVSIPSAMYEWSAKSGQVWRRTIAMRG